MSQARNIENEYLKSHLTLEEAIFKLIRAVHTDSANLDVAELSSDFKKACRAFLRDWTPEDLYYGTIIPPPDQRQVKTACEWLEK
jgi:hypothetical protein